MAWTNLPTNYQDIQWTGLRKYEEFVDSDGIKSFADVTQYWNTNHAQLSATELNKICDAINKIMGGQVFYTEAEVDALLLTKQDILTFDTTPTTSSSNPVTSNGIKIALDAINSRIDSLSGFTVHICGNGEYDPSTLQPTIQDPDPSTFYLVPSGGTNPDVFQEWVYVNNAWEIFGSAAVDLSNYVTTSELAQDLAGKQDTLTFDTVPTTSSSNPVTSDGIATALLGKADASHNHDSRYYTEGEVDNLVNGLQPALTFDTVPATSSSNPVTSDGIATALLGKADASHNHDSRYYTETEIDTLLSGKVDNSSIGTMAAEDKTNFYDKTVADALLDEKADIIHTNASGSVVSILDGAEYPVDALTVTIEPKQDLHGQANPYPAGAGKNLCDPSKLSQEYDGLVWGYYDTGILLKQGNTYTFSVSNSLGINSIGIWGTDHTTQYAHKGTGVNWVSYSPNVDKYVCLRVYRSSGLDVSDVTPSIQLEVGSSATSYAPYSNICPISGWSEVKITKTGKNLLQKINGVKETNGITFTPNSDGSVTISGTASGIAYYNFDFVASLSSAVWDLSRFTGVKLRASYGATVISGMSMTMGYFKSDGTYNTAMSGVTTGSVFTYPSDAVKARNYIVVSNGTAITTPVTVHPMVCVASDADNTYEAYKSASVTVDLDGTIYGGSRDVLTGILTVDRGIVDMGTLTWSYDSDKTRFSATMPSDYRVPLTVAQRTELLSSMYYADSSPIGMTLKNGTISGYSDSKIYLYNFGYTDAVTFTAAMSGVYLVYYLATPQTIQLTAKQLSLYLGSNNVWTDTGETIMTYRADTKQYIDNYPHHIYYVKGTQTASTGTWTGDLPEVEGLYEGLTINYYLPYAGNGNATLNLTLKDGVSTGPINCYVYNNSRLTTHIGAGYVCQLVYQTITYNGANYTGWYLLKSIDNNDVGSQLRRNNDRLIADSAVYRYQLLFHTDTDTVTPLNNANNDTGTSKTMLTNVEFNPFNDIYYWYTTSTVSAGGALPNNNAYYQRGDVDLRYAFNCGQTLTAYKLLYLKVTMLSNGKCKIASDPCWAQTLPSTADGYHYILLGRTYSAYQMSMFAKHPIYYHDGTALRELVDPAYGLGAMSMVDDAPSNGSEYVRKNGAWAVASGGGSGSVFWGSISGSISSQTDLQDALDAKADAANLGTMSAVNDASSNDKIYGRKNGTWVEVPDDYTDIVFYVNPSTGSDTNSGKSDAPFKTIAHAVDSIPVNGCGWILLPYGGTISEGISIGDPSYQQSKTVKISVYSNITVNDINCYKGCNLIFHSSGNVTVTCKEIYVHGGFVSFDGSANLGGVNVVITQPYGGIGIEVSEGGQLICDNSVTYQHNGSYDTFIESIQGSRVYVNTVAITSGYSINTCLHADYGGLIFYGSISGGSATYWEKAEHGGVIASGFGDLAFEEDAPSDGREYVRKNGHWYIASGGISSVSWGDISGSISSQTDLQSALDNRVLPYSGVPVSTGTNTQIARIPASGTDDNITTDTVLLRCEFSDESKITSDCTWTCYDGYFVISGTCTAAITALVVLGN